MQISRQALALMITNAKLISNEPVLVQTTDAHLYFTAFDHFLALKERTEFEHSEDSECVPTEGISVGIKELEYALKRIPATPTAKATIAVEDGQLVIEHFKLPEPPHSGRDLAVLLDGFVGKETFKLAVPPEIMSKFGRVRLAKSECSRMEFFQGTKHGDKSNYIVTFKHVPQMKEEVLLEAIGIFSPIVTTSTPPDLTSWYDKSLVK